MALIRDLAVGATGSWTIVFVASELDFYVQFVAAEASQSSVKWSVDDMLIRTPKDSLHARALANLLSLVAAGMKSDIDLPVRVG